MLFVHWLVRNYLFSILPNSNYEIQEYSFDHLSIRACCAGNGGESVFLGRVFGGCSRKDHFNSKEERRNGTVSIWQSGHVSTCWGAWWIDLDESRSFRTISRASSADQWELFCREFLRYAESYRFTEFIGGEICSVQPHRTIWIWYLWLFHYLLQ